MRKIKSACKGRLRKFMRAFRYEIGFGGFEQSLAGDAEAIF
ncbi:MAG TPA: hypothetical protein VIY49_27820 [Bryobacteraceae bacterium]